MRSPKRLDLTGKVFSQWTVVSYTGDYHKGWNCQCICGTSKSVLTSNLVRGYSTKCRKCWRISRIKDRDPLALFNLLLNGYKANAKRTGRIWTLTAEDFRTITSGHCSYCGSAPSRTFRYHKVKGTHICTGIDRVDSTKGYTLENSVSCCFPCNRMKSNLPVYVFLAKVSSIVSHQESKGTK